MCKPISHIRRMSVNSTKAQDVDDASEPPALTVVPIATIFALWKHPPQKGKSHGLMVDIEDGPTNDNERVLVITFPLSRHYLFQ